MDTNLNEILKTKVKEAFNGKWGVSNKTEVSKLGDGLWEVLLIIENVEDLSKERFKKFVIDINFNLPVQLQVSNYIGDLKNSLVKLEGGY